MKTPFSKKTTPADTVIDTETLREDQIDALIDERDPEAFDAHSEQVLELEQQLHASEDARLRALADYQNLQRRSQSDRAAWSKLATQAMVASILEPLEHLQMAATQLADPGLTMVVKQLFERLAEQGLEKIEVVGQPFNPETMEAIAGSHPQGKKVSSVVQNGYTLNGVLIQPAKVKVE